MTTPSVSSLLYKQYNSSSIPREISVLLVFSQLCVLQFFLISPCQVQEAIPAGRGGSLASWAVIWGWALCVCVCADSCCLFLSCILQCSQFASHTKLYSCTQLKGYLKSSMSPPCACSQSNKDSTFSRPAPNTFLI